MSETAVSAGAVPTPTPETAEFWLGCRQGKLRMQFCKPCDAFYFYPRPFCPRCSGTDVEWRDLGGGGSLLSYVINYRPYPPTSDGWPQVVALVELDEGPRLMTNIVGGVATPEELPLDARVHVEFRARGDQMLPVFRLEESE
jgi:uncharacterized OB-fold protein